MSATLSNTIAETLSRAIELTGIVVMIGGGVFAAGVFLWRIWRTSPPPGFDSLYRELRANIGRAILLGLELLVAADIIGTVAIEPSFRNVGVLGLIVAIRTFLSFSLELEISGKWPWQGRESVRSALSTSREERKTPGHV
ncbi:MAG TPA: DUF1622 domain-containing protein [Gemmatimonadaceae bacterium]